MSASPRPQLSAVEPNAPPEYADDRALIDAVNRGDERAAGALYDQLRPVIEHVLRRILRGRRDDFEDLLQITFERIFQGFAEDRFESRCRLTTWAGAIASHVALDTLRRRLREEQRIVTRDTEAAPAHEEKSLQRHIEARSELTRIHDILSRMKPRLAETLILHDVLGHGLSEVAELTCVTPSAAQSRLFRARKELHRRARAQILAGGKS